MPKLLRLAAALAAFAAPAGAQTVQTTYDLYIAGLRAGQLTLAANRTETGYSAASSIRTAGLIGAFARYEYDGQASGRLDSQGAVTPQRFSADSRSPNRRRTTEIEWRGGAPTRIANEPPRADIPEPAALAGALDPISAAVALLGDSPPDQLCDASVDIFDGSRLARLDLGPARLTDRGHVCEGSYARTEGDAPTVSDEDAFPFRLVFRENGAGLAQLHRIETRTRFGNAILERRG